MATVIEELVLAIGYKVDSAALDRAAKAANSNAKKTEEEYKKAAREVELAQKRLAAAVDEASKAAAQSALDAATKSRDAAKDALEDMGREAEKTSKHIGEQIGGALKKIGTAFAAVGIAGAAALGGLVIHGIETAKEIDVTANKLGLTTTELQRLEQAAMASDGSSEAMRKTIGKLREGLGELASTGGGPAKDTLGALGLSLSDLANIPVEQQLGKIGDALNLVQDPAKRTSIIMRLLGEDGLQLQTTLAGGTAGIAALGDAAQRSGNVMDASLVASAVRVEDRMRVAKTQIAAVGLTIFEELLPSVEEMATGTGNWVDENEDLIKQDLPDLMRATAEAAGALVSVLASIARGLSDVRTGFQKWRLEVADSDGWVGNIDRTILGWQGKERDSTGNIVDAGKGRSKFNAQSRAEYADDSMWESTSEFDRGGVNVDPAANAARVQAQVDAMRAQAAAAGGAAISQRAQRNRAAKFEADARKAAAGGGGGGKGKTAEQRAAEAALAAAYVQLKTAGVEDELRAMGVRAGASDMAVDAALKSAAESAAKGTSRKVFRGAGVSSLSSSTGVDLSKRQSDPLLSAMFGEDMLPDVPLSELERGQQPQVLISTINNTYTVSVPISVDGARDPMAVATDVREQFETVLREKLSAVSRFSKVVFDR